MQKRKVVNVTARDREEIKVKQIIQEKLSKLPEFMSEFELLLDTNDENDFRTRLQYIEHVSEFLNWLNEHKGYKLNCTDDLKQIKYSDVSE